MTPHTSEWTFKPIDAGMGETEYNIFADAVFFARVNNRADVASLIHAMKLANPRPAPSPDCMKCTKAADGYCLGKEEGAAQAREDALKELYDWLDEKVNPDEAMMRILTIGKKIQSLRSTPGGE